MLVRIAVVFLLSLGVGYVCGVVAHETYHAIERNVPVTQACYFGWWKMPGMFLFGWVNGQDVTATPSAEEDAGTWIWAVTTIGITLPLSLFLAIGYLPKEKST